MLPPFGFWNNVTGNGIKTVSSMLEQFAVENNNKTVTDFLRFSEVFVTLPFNA